MKRFAALFLAAVALLAAAPLDSQIVLERYELEIGDLKTPKAMIFSYSVSQAGTTDIEQRHRVYRSGLHVRDETLGVNGESLAKKIVRVSERPDRYAITRLAPRVASYTLLFLRTVRDGTHRDYVYEATPLVATSGFVVTRVTIDGRAFLPKVIDFRTTAGNARGVGQLEYGKVGAYWVPLSATVQADVHGARARERITWSDYRFPRSLPAQTFNTPKPLPEATLPPV